MVTVQYCLMSRYFVHSVSPLGSSNAKTHLLQEEDTTTLAHWYVWSRNIWMSAKNDVQHIKHTVLYGHNVRFLVTCLQSGGRDREEGYRTRHSDQHVHTLTHVPSQPAAAAGCSSSWLLPLYSIVIYSSLCHACGKG